jgi:hypothetical protein
LKKLERIFGGIFMKGFNFGGFKSGGPRENHAVATWNAESI